MTRSAWARLRLWLSPPSSLAGFQTAKHGGVPRLTEYFFGLLGPSGPLPLFLTEYAYQRQKSARDGTFASFLDVFHHRMLTLFYRAWANARPTVSFDRPKDDWFGVYLASLMGIGIESLRDRNALPDHAKLYHAGSLSAQVKNPSGLRSMIEDFFQLPARIEEFIGAWLELPSDQRLYLGKSRATGLLGHTAIAGAKIWSRQHKFRLVLGPMSIESYERFLPGQPALARLKALVRGYVGDELDWDVRLSLFRDEAPALKLSGSARLGWSSWLGTPSDPGDLNDLVIVGLSPTGAEPGEEVHNA